MPSPTAGLQEDNGIRFGQAVPAPRFLLQFKLWQLTKMKMSKTKRFEPYVNLRGTFKRNRKKWSGRMSCYPDLIFLVEFEKRLFQKFFELISICGASKDIDLLVVLIGYIEAISIKMGRLYGTVWKFFEQWSLGGSRADGWSENDFYFRKTMLIDSLSKGCGYFLQNSFAFVL